MRRAGRVAKGPGSAHTGGEGSTKCDSKINVWQGKFPGGVALDG